MKNKLLFPIIAAFILLNNSFYGFSQKNEFSLNSELAKNIKHKNINRQFNKSTNLKKIALQNISGIFVTADFSLNSYDSYVRIILRDTSDYQEYLIYEAFYPKNELNKLIKIKNYAYETTSLWNINGFEIDVQINNAICDIKKFTYITDENNLKKAEYKREKQTIKEKQDSIIISKINKNLIKSNQKWEAKENELTKLSYNEKKCKLPKNDKGEIPNMQGFEYYSGGVFEAMTDKTNPNSSTTSEFIYTADFDWRDRHGQNWLTPIKQQQCGHCWVFSAVASIEALANIYFNFNLNTDLSEQDAASCSRSKYPLPVSDPERWRCNGGLATDVLKYAKNYGIVLEECFPYVARDEIDEPCKTINNGGNKCDNPVESISIFDYETYFHTQFDELSLKRAIVENGPSIIALDNWHHYMSIIGFGTIKEGDIIRDGTDGVKMDMLLLLQIFLLIILII